MVGSYFSTVFCLCFNFGVFTHRASLIAAFGILFRTIIAHERIEQKETQQNRRRKTSTTKALYFMIFWIEEKLIEIYMKHNETEKYVIDV